MKHPNLRINVLLLILSISLHSCMQKPEWVTNIAIKEGVSLEINIGNSNTLHAEHSPAHLQAPNYTWESSNNSIVKVDATGVITAMKVGEATITVKITNTQIKAQCKIKVLPIDVNKIELTPKEKTLNVGETFTITSKITPENATNAKINWKSSDTKVAKVDKGVVTATGVGSCKITATTEDGGHTGECNVTVNSIEVSEIKLNHDNKTIEVDESFVLSATILPDNATDKTINWTSSDTSIATIKTDGTVTGIKEGNCTITATDKSGNHKAECQLTVKPISVKGITLNDATIKLEMGEQKQLTYAITPTNAANQDVKWSVKDNAIASISEDGIITANKLGETKVTVKTIDGEYTAECTIKVVDFTELIYTYFSSATIASYINGYFQGSINCLLVNNSSKDITVKSILVADSNNGLGNTLDLENESVPANQSVGYTVNILISMYHPIFRWTYIYENKEYTLDIVYRGSIGNPNAKRSNMTIRKELICN
ncbi:Ig-like domain-containing protein [Phocaeicola sp.]